ncbi:MAG: hypothetical protein UU70_C0006G0006 [Candidatus Yanofskybacteria bacterium GW2011_GWA1_41_6]|uniref:Uncharacterized protein n=1 Tax=Candidatus Yanofskybacteria bacterium GW2011_GWA1_41_6 TaxID=1619020 RepID=A0A0G0WP47_9BACT|nr:MAG: hypothetical protein UU70_C0006G0006 [Candidatus Yanofskybacteria bacterium GW2011_GWA1_41_6]
MSTIYRIYTKDFKELKKSGNLALIVSVVSLVISTITFFR